MHVMEHSASGSSRSSSDGKEDDSCCNDGGYLWIQGPVFIFFDSERYVHVHKRWLNIRDLASYRIKSRREHLDV